MYTRIPALATSASRWRNKTLCGLGSHDRRPRNTRSVGSSAGVLLKLQPDTYWHVVLVMSILHHYFNLLIFVMHSIYSLLSTAPFPYARQGVVVNIYSEYSNTDYPGGLLRCDPPSPANAQPVQPVEDKRDRANLLYRAPTTCSQPLCPYPIAASHSSKRFTPTKWLNGLL